MLHVRAALSFAHHPNFRQQHLKITLQPWQEDCSLAECKQSDGATRAPAVFGLVDLLLKSLSTFLLLGTQVVT